MPYNLYLDTPFGRQNMRIVATRLTIGDKNPELIVGYIDQELSERFEGTIFRTIAGRITPFLTNDTEVNENRVALAGALQKEHEQLDLWKREALD